MGSYSEVGRPGAVASYAARALAAFHASNVEDYLWRNGVYDRLLANLATFPRADHAVVIRSIIGRSGSRSESAPIATLIDAR